MQSSEKKNIVLNGFFPFRVRVHSRFIVKYRWINVTLSGPVDLYNLLSEIFKDTFAKQLAGFCSCKLVVEIAFVRVVFYSSASQVNLPEI